MQLLAAGLTAVLSICAAADKGLPVHSPITPVEGPSNLQRLGLTVQTSMMGWTGAYGSLSAVRPAYFEQTSGPRILSGADVYRLGCRACHQADGSGMPPEIPPIFGPVQATSASLLKQRMKERERPITEAFARELTSGSKKDLLDRIQKGGEKMPPFGYLSTAEVDALISYLNVLAKIPGAGKQQTVTEPKMRVGELLVKGTCHICHGATGPWPNPEQLLQGAVPPISGFTAKSLPEVIGKVRYGAPVVMGYAGFSYRGRMPVFAYLSNDEVAAAYLYLIHYPPE